MHTSPSPPHSFEGSISNMVHVEKSFYGTTKDGKEVDKYTLANENGVQVEVISFGAVTVAIKCPDKYVIYCALCSCV